MEKTTQYDTKLARWIIDTTFEHLEEDFTVKQLAEMSEKEIVSKAKNYEYSIAESMSYKENECYDILKRLQVKDWGSWNERYKFAITSIYTLALCAVLAFMREYKLAEEVGREFVHGTDEEVNRL